MSTHVTRQDIEFLVDDALVNAHTWSFSGTGYITALVRRDGRRTRVSLAREVLGITDPTVQVDHRNGDPLDNRRRNLRPASTSQNLANRRKWLVGEGGARSTLTKGVNLSREGRYCAVIRENGRRISKTFDTEAEAGAWYAEQAERIWGGYAVTRRTA